MYRQMIFSIISSSKSYNVFCKQVKHYKKQTMKDVTILMVLSVYYSLKLLLAYC